MNTFSIVRIVWKIATWLCTRVRKHILCNSPSTFRSIFVRKAVIKDLMNIQGLYPTKDMILKAMNQGLRWLDFSFILLILEFFWILMMMLDSLLYFPCSCSKAHEPIAGYKLQYHTWLNHKIRKECIVQSSKNAGLSDWTKSKLFPKSLSLYKNLYC